MSFIRTGLRELGSESSPATDAHGPCGTRSGCFKRAKSTLGREGTSQAANFPELRNEIVALKKLEQEQKEVALRIAQIEEGIKKIEAAAAANARNKTKRWRNSRRRKSRSFSGATKRKNAADLCDRELTGVERRIRKTTRPIGIC